MRERLLELFGIIQSLPFEEDRGLWLWQRGFGSWACLALVTGAVAESWAVGATPAGDYIGLLVDGGSHKFTPY